ncbi:hypothetical protein [Bradyrhizobium sp.]|uniref:hypothetical protein n=1 Tax=Bradyrhizobium sp. TaxID=376 RepID=UPI0039E38314
MGSEIIRPEDDDALPAPMPEVEFALVLSRMIDSVKNDPEHLRQTVYELARHKLQEQLASEGRPDQRKLSKALETAILGVETFVKNNDDFSVSNGPAALPPPRASAHGAEDQWSPGRPASPMVEVLAAPTSAKRRSFWLTTLGLLVLMLPLPWVLSYAVHGTGPTSWLRGVASSPAVPPQPVSPNQAAVAAPAAASKESEKAAREASPLVPKAYGIYAVSADKLYELDMLPGRVPDMRVAISALIATPSRTVLPDGHLKFIVYRRDSATSAADRAEIRIIAKIENELTFDKAGKPVTTKAEDGWVIRNISVPYRTAPSKDEADMYEVQSEDPDKPLAPGRYALVLKGQAYDFTVAGQITDLRHCLERMAATNGQFYSECQKK